MYFERKVYVTVVNQYHLPFLVTMNKRNTTKIKYCGFLERQAVPVEGV